MASLEPLTVVPAELPAGPAAVRAPRAGAGLSARLGVLGWTAAVVLAVIVLSAILAPVLPLKNPDQTFNLSSLGTGPSAAHWLGTDELGRDELSRLIYGGRDSLLVGFGSTLLGLLAGSIVGIAAGYLGGLVELVIVTIVDTMLAFPSLVLVLALAAALGSSTLTVVIIVGIGFLPLNARLARTATQQVVQEGYILAARSLGAPGRRIVIREIVPGIWRTLLTFGLLEVGIAVGLEGALGFLGVTGTGSAPNWGAMIANGQQVFSFSPQVPLLPAAMLCLTVLSLSFLADRLGGGRSIMQATR
jgi:peptide/nickel transport system permease protein